MLKNEWTPQLLRDSSCANRGILPTKLPAWCIPPSCQEQLKFLVVVGGSMICIYQEHNIDALQTVDEHHLRCKVKWLETTAKNLCSALLAIEHAPSAQRIEGQFHIEIDGVMFEPRQLPHAGPNLSKRCSFWLNYLRGTRARSTAPTPVFGL